MNIYAGYLRINGYSYSIEGISKEDFIEHLQKILGACLQDEAIFNEGTYATIESLRISEVPYR